MVRPSWKPGCPIRPEAASRAVVVVPMFAPRMNGKTRFTSKKPIAARGTTIEVLAELDCTRIVTRSPRTKVSTGFLPRSLSPTWSRSSVSTPCITSARIRTEKPRSAKSSRGSPAMASSQPGRPMERSSSATGSVQVEGLITASTSSMP